MNEGWITDRLPTFEDSVAHCVYVYDDDLKDVRIWSYGAVKLGIPWQPIPRVAPYVKPISNKVPPPPPPPFKEMVANSTIMLREGQLP